MSCNCVVCDSYSCIKIVPIFAHLNSDEMAQVASITSERTYEKGQTIYRVGESRGELYVLHSGSVKVYRLSADGKEQVLRRVQSGQFLGELSLFSNNKQTDNAVALETSQMCVIKWDNLRSLIEKIPSIAFKVMEELSNRLEQTESRLEQTNLQTVEQRLAHYLITASEDKDVFELELSKGDLASLLGTTQETLSRRLSLFQQNNLIELEGQRKIKIIDRLSLLDYGDFN
jgi:CRP-like cAMP-binding protein